MYGLFWARELENLGLVMMFHLVRFIGVGRVSQPACSKKDSSMFLWEATHMQLFTTFLAYLLI